MSGYGIIGRYLVNYTVRVSGFAVVDREEVVESALSPRSDFFINDMRKRITGIERRLFERRVQSGELDADIDDKVRVVVIKAAPAFA